jgi:hypothetical protein
MPIPSSGALSLSAIQTEFGGSNPISISEYYAGGGLVPSGTSGTNGAVPSSGQISFSQFYGTSAILVALNPNYSFVNFQFDDLAASGIRIGNDGAVYELAESGVGITQNQVDSWIAPTSAAGNGYEVRVSAMGGDGLTGSATNTWLGLGTTREWYIVVDFVGQNKFANFTLEIRNATTLTVLASSYVELSAQTV